ncbi:MAG: hypothetical protein AB7D51_13455 [Desulfovibrionaceae bacterium]
MKAVGTDGKKNQDIYNNEASVDDVFGDVPVFTKWKDEVGPADACQADKRESSAKGGGTDASAIRKKGCNCPECHEGNEQVQGVCRRIIACNVCRVEVIEHQEHDLDQ